MTDYQEDVSRMGVSFHLKTDDKTFLCFISGEALQDHFHASSSFEEAFEQNRDAIEAKALTKIRKSNNASNNEVLIGNSDFL